MRQRVNRPQARSRSPAQGRKTQRNGGRQHDPTLWVSGNTLIALAPTAAGDDQEAGFREAAGRAAAATGVEEAGRSHPYQHEDPERGSRRRRQPSGRDHDGAWWTPQAGQRAPVARPIRGAGVRARFAVVSHGRPARNRTRSLRSPAPPGSAGRARRHRSRRRSNRRPWASNTAPQAGQSAKYWQASVGMVSAANAPHAGQVRVDLSSIARSLIRASSSEGPADRARSAAARGAQVRSGRWLRRAGRPSAATGARTSCHPHIEERRGP